MNQAAGSPSPAPSPMAQLAATRRSQQVPTLKDTFGQARLCCWVTCLKDILPNMESRPRSPPLPTRAILSPHSAHPAPARWSHRYPRVRQHHSAHTHIQPTFKAPPKTQTLIFAVAEQCRSLHLTGDVLLCLLLEPLTGHSALDRLQPIWIHSIHTKHTLPV